SAYVSLSMLLIVGCGDFEIVVPDPLSATIVPQHGSIDTSRDVDVFVFFSEPVADRDSALDDIEVRCLGAPPCQQPTSSACTVELPALARSFDGANQTARLVPDTPLQANTCFLITVQAGIEAADSNTGAFPVEVRSSFQTGL
ncbi:MAG: Ig-like domain-containing protein, partial [Myxococcota bacterium]